MKKSGYNNNGQDGDQMSEDEGNEEGARNQDYDDYLAALEHIPEEEHQLVEDFLDKYVFSNDPSNTTDQVDLNLALKALPLKIDETNIYRIDLMNFGILYHSLVAFQNDQ